MVVTSWLVARTTRLPVRPAAVRVSAPSTASVASPDSPVVCVAPAASSRPATIPVWLASSRDDPLAMICTSPKGSVTPVPVAAFAVPAVVTTL